MQNLALYMICWPAEKDLHYDANLMSLCYVEKIIKLFGVGCDLDEAYSVPLWYKICFGIL